MKPKLIIQLEKEIGIKISNFKEKTDNIHNLYFKQNEDGQIVSLSLSNQNLGIFPKSICKMHKIENLILENNKILTLPDDISKLKNLKKLFLGGNKLEEIPYNLLKMDYLSVISLVANNIRTIKKEVLNFKYPIYLDFQQKRSKGIYLSDNPIETPPIEIIEQGKEAVKNYFAELEKGKVNLYETKLLLVGHGAVGKTSLMKRLINDDYNNHESSTEGIDIKQWNLLSEDDKELKINIWDFGGQDIYYSTHQFFLSKRSLYILVWDARIEKMMPNMASFDYWLNIVSLLSQKSPILVVHSKVDERIRRIDESLLLKHFPNIVGFYDVSAKNGTGIKELKKIIQTEIRKLSHVGDTLPKAWFDIRNKLKQTNKEFINYEKYISICKAHQLNTRQALHLSDFFHDLGIFLHFQRNDILRNLIFIKPEWATNAVYKIIDTKEVVINFGKFSSSQLPDIWYDYPENKYAFLIELMKKFEICYKLPDTNNYMVPELFPPSKPNINWDYTDNLHFEFRYKFMPAGIITRLIVRMHDYIRNNIYWFQGAVIEREQTKAVVTSDILERHVKIKIKGKNKQDLFGIIRYEIERINKTLKQPYVELMTPCSCEICKNNEEPEFYAFQTLNRALDNGIKTIQCRASFENISINKLLGKINGNGKQQSLFDYILLALKQLQGLRISLQIPEYEDSRNNFVANVLTNKNFRVKDQTQFGKSETGKRAGEIDIKIDDDKGATIAIYEAFNLKYFDKTKISNHLTKIFNYDANGLHENYIIVYSDKNFIGNWQKYKKYISEIEYKHKILDFNDISNNYDINTNIKVGIAKHERNKKTIKIYHIFVEM